jgi:hypothetical protein
MKGVVLTLAEEFKNLSQEELTELFKKEAEDFSNWMARLPDWKYQGPLTKPETVLLTTYLMQKYAGKIDGGA